ncbi:hypothetical protein CS0771_09070 [Catellatospora sp. IY07-71]|uniref:DUF2516 family protein n=1 Tax=Catellatospora sp. IY07-71 TaxID=2728827 RepID=UPI001BB4373F|nr:DUF2516 family protein [Catellatospora sp. IY07-71]BCJ71363.1 hypothetical protein CS0771_09070 [Catellatospora sp. IY07-71]
MVFEIVYVIQLVFWYGFIALLLWAFVDCLLRRKDAFPAIGTMPKAGWLIVLLVAMLFVWLARWYSEFIAMAGGGLAAYYLLDVRRGLREVAEGHW